MGTVNRMMAATSSQTQRMGRKRDLSRNGPILEAALEVLAEFGYERMTTDMVAARARASKATLYRRWPSKAELVVEAVQSLDDGAERTLRDTGSLEGDLAALIRAPDDASAWMMQILAGLLSMLPRNPDLARVVRRRLAEPQIAVMRELLERAQRRGEIAADRNLDVLALVLPAIAAYRLIIDGEQIDRRFARLVVKEVLAPASLAGA